MYFVGKSCGKFVDLCKWKYVVKKNNDGNMKYSRSKKENHHGG